MLPPDNDIIKALNGDDEFMFEKVFRNYYNPLCRYASAILNDPEEAEDIVQHTMVKVWEMRRSINIQSSLKSYLYRMVHNASLNKIKHLKVREAHSKEVSAGMNENAAPASEKIVRSELQNAIMDAINKLPEQCRMVFKLSRFEEMKYSEIADHLNISVKTVENHMGKALKLLRENLKDLVILLILFSVFI